MNIKVDPHSSAPIYEQMVDAIISSIDSCRLATGDKLPSVRALSAQLGINPNTTARVYRELEIRGYIEGRAGSGCFVLPKNEAAAAKVKTVRMQQLFTQMLHEAKARRIEEAEFLQFLKARTSA